VTTADESVTQRPDYKRKRGELRIYLGAAPGVGKTYAMLGEAHRRVERGTDLVAAVVMICGLGVFGLWTGILATGFAAETRRDNFLKTWESVSKVPFFAALGPSAIADVTHMLRTMDLPARTMIIKKGQVGDCMYFIAAGEVEVDLPGKKVTLGEGAFFGEMALLGSNLRSANITTTRVSKLLVLDLVDFRLLMARHPDLAETIDAEARRRVLENK